MKRIKRVFGSVKNLTKDEFGGSTSSVLSRLTATKSVASKSSFENKNEFNIKDGTYMGYDFQASPLHGSHLIDYADPLNYSDQSSTKLHKYCFTSDLTKVKKFLKKVNINSQDAEGRTPLHLAASAGHLEVVLLLMGERVNPEIEDYDGRTPFLIAVERNRIEIVQIFLKHKVDGLAKDKYGNQAVHLAARTGAKDVIDLLIDAGLDVNGGNGLDQTPLHIATENLNMEVVKSLLNCKLNINAVDKESVTPLMLAAKTGSNPITNLLLEAGAELHLIDSSGWNAAAYAKYSMHEAIEQKLVALTLSDFAERRPEDQTQSLDRMAKKHVRSISDSYDSWTESSISESQKLKLTYFHAETDNGCSSKTLPRQRLSDSSLGPPKPPRLYTSTPNLDMTEPELEDDINSKQNTLNKQFSKHSTDGKELSYDNTTVKSDITFENDDNSFLDLSLGIESVSEKNKEVLHKPLKHGSSRSHSLSPKNSVGDRNILKRAQCDIGGDGFTADSSSWNDESCAFSNKDQLNEIEEVWESNAHFSLCSPVRSQAIINSVKEDISHPIETNVNTNDWDLPENVIINEKCDLPSSVIVESNIKHSSTVNSPSRVESPKKLDDSKSEESSLNLLLTSSTPSGREELQGLVRKLRNALLEVNITSKGKDHSLASLKKSESFLKRQLKEIEKKTSDLAEQNSDFMYRLENLKAQTSDLKDEATSVCHSLEYDSNAFAIVESRTHKSNLAHNFNLLDKEGKQEYVSIAKFDLNDESAIKKTELGNIIHATRVEIQAGIINDITSQQLPIANEAVFKHIETSETSAQTDFDKSILKEAQTQTCSVNREDICSRGMNTDPQQVLNKPESEKCCSEDFLFKLFNESMEKWRVILAESFVHMRKSVETDSSRDHLMSEINERLDHLNEQVPHYSKDVKAAIESSLCFNESLYKKINNIERSCEPISEFQELSNLFKGKDDKIESVLSNLMEMKQDLGKSLSRLETAINDNYSSAKILSQKSDEKLARYMDCVNNKMSSIEYNFDLMQSTLTEKILAFCNVSDEIKEVSCGMRRISDNYGAINDTRSGQSLSESAAFDLMQSTAAFDLKLKEMSAKFEDCLIGFGESLVQLRQDTTLKLNNFNELSIQNEKYIHIVREICDKFSMVDKKFDIILQNDSPETHQFSGIENRLDNNEKYIQDIKHTVQSVYQLLKTFEDRLLLDQSIDSSQDKIGSSVNKNVLSKIDLNVISNKIDSFSQTDVQNNFIDTANQFNVLEDENRLLIAEIQLLRKTFDQNISGKATKSILSNNEYSNWVLQKAGIEEEIKSLKKMNRELTCNLTILETDCNELEEELDLKNMEMQNQKKINAIQKKEIKEIKQQLPFIASLQNEKFSLEEQAIRFEHSEFEYKQIIEQLQAKVVELSKDNIYLSSKVSNTGGKSMAKEDHSNVDKIDTGLEFVTNDKDLPIDSLFANIDSHFQSIVSKKLKELNEMLEERLPQGSSMKKSWAVENYQREMIKLQREIINMKDEIEQVDCDKERWHAKYDDLHERYQKLQQNQPFLRTPEESEDCFEKVLENIEDQLKVPYPFSRFVESGHPDSDYFSSLRYSTNSGSSSLEPKSTDRTFISVLRPNYSSTKEHTPSTDIGHIVIPLFATSRAENKSAIKAYNNPSSSHVEQSCERYIDFLQVKHSC